MSTTREKLKLELILVCIFCSVISVLSLMNVSMATAAELVYTPINPSFGGSSFNAQWLSSSAEAQNEFKEKLQKSPMERFEDRLTQQILSRLANKIVDEAFGEEETLEPGRYEIGDYTIDVNTDGETISVVINDLEGDSTTIEIPYYKD